MGGTLGIVLQVGFLLGLHLQDALHVVLVGELRGTPAECDHALHPGHTSFRVPPRTRGLAPGGQSLLSLFPSAVRWPSHAAVSREGGRKHPPTSPTTHRLHTHSLALGPVEVICAAGQLLIVHVRTVGGQMPRGSVTSGDRRAPTQPHPVSSHCLVLFKAQAGGSRLDKAVSLSRAPVF